ncbi:MAG: DUF615 domain-containing protein [Ottowia sp.]|nr:DUF615 domain-containing protein [Ottowia sp.]
MHAPEHTEIPGERPSKTARKAQSAALQALGERLVTLPAAQLDALQLPERLLAALDEARHIRDFGALRRQRQFIGRLMRQLDEEQLDAIRATFEARDATSAEHTALLHAAEGWRERLMQSDAALSEWLAQHPHSDAQRLRALLRQARKDAAAQQGSPTPQGSRAWRELFRLLRDELQEHDTY